MSDVQNTWDGAMVKIKCTFNCLTICTFFTQSCNAAELCTALKVTCG